MLPKGIKTIDAELSTQIIIMGMMVLFNLRKAIGLCAISMCLLLGGTNTMAEASLLQKPSLTKILLPKTKNLIKKSYAAAKVGQVLYGKVGIGSSKADIINMYGNPAEDHIFKDDPDSATGKEEVMESILYKNKYKVFMLSNEKVFMISREVDFTFNDIKKVLGRPMYEDSDMLTYKARKYVLGFSTTPLDGQRSGKINMIVIDLKS